MPIYMDIHHVPGAEALDLAEAHRKDILVQSEYQCKCLTYWLDEARGSAFCLIEAPDDKVVIDLHKNSHGLTPHKVIEVKNELVQSFLGRIHDPEGAQISDSGLKVFSDSAFRILLVTDITDPVLLCHRLGAEETGELLNKQNRIIRKELAAHQGREVEYAGNGFIISFTSAARAVACALDIQKNLSAAEKKLSGLKIGINAGDPIAKSDNLFGDTIQFARHLCTVADKDKIIIASAVQQILARDYFQINRKHFIILSLQEEAFLELLFTRLEKNWQDADFGVPEFCKNMSMSKSQLYRKTMAIWGLSPNLLLKEFRLVKAKELLKNKSFNISQATFDSGFTSPSYFTKCFKTKFGLLPAAYQDSLR